MVKITEENIVFLTITSWVGVGIGTHYYGRLRPCNGEGSFDVNYRLSQIEADRFNRHTKVKYEVGEETSRFLSRNKVVAAARKQFKKRFPTATILILGDRAVVEPQQVLVGPKEFKDKINVLAARYDELDWYIKLDRAAMNAVLKNVETLFGIDVNLGHATYWDHEVKFSMVVSTLTETGEKQQDEDNFVLHAPHYGFKAEDFGKDFTTRGRQFKIVGWNNRRYKYPLRAKEVFSGKIVCFQTHTVLKLMGRISTVPSFK